VRCETEQSFEGKMCQEYSYQKLSLLLSNMSVQCVYTTYVLIKAQVDVMFFLLKPVVGFVGYFVHNSLFLEFQ